MSDRRSMAEALKMTPKAIDFIENGVPKTRGRAATQQSNISELDHTEPTTLVELDAAPPEAETHPDKKLKAKKEKVLPTKTAESPMLTTPVVFLTTRLTQATAETLRRASLERKLAGQSPSSQQDMVELAVGQWLEENGYLR